jgi:hypothetical protein
MVTTAALAVAGEAISKTNELEVALDEVSSTVMLAVPGCAIAELETCAVRISLVPKVVARAMPFHWSTEDPVNPEPSAQSVKLPPPAMAYVVEAEKLVTSLRVIDGGGGGGVEACPPPHPVTTAAAPAMIARAAIFHRLLPVEPKFTCQSVPPVIVGREAVAWKDGDEKWLVLKEYELESE